MSSATQKKAKILGHVALVLEDNMPLTGRLRLISCDQEWKTKLNVEKYLPRAWLSKHQIEYSKLVKITHTTSF